VQRCIAQLVVRRVRVGNPCTWLNSHGGGQLARNRTASTGSLTDSTSSRSLLSSVTPSCWSQIALLAAVGMHCVCRFEYICPARIVPQRSNAASHLRYGPSFDGTMLDSSQGCPGSGVPSCHATKMHLFLAVLFARTFRCSGLLDHDNKAMLWPMISDAADKPSRTPWTSRREAHGHIHDPVAYHAYESIPSYVRLSISCRTCECCNQPCA
jgi:hypothetical protein